MCCWIMDGWGMFCNKFMKQSAEKTLPARLVCALSVLFIFTLVRYPTDWWETSKCIAAPAAFFIQRAIMLSSLHFARHNISLAAPAVSAPSGGSVFPCINLISSDGKHLKQNSLQTSHPPITQLVLLGGRSWSGAMFTDHKEWWSEEMSCHAFAVPAGTPESDQSWNDCFVWGWNKYIPLHLQQQKGCFTAILRNIFKSFKY